MGQVKGDQYLVEMVLKGQEQVAKGLDNVAKSVARLSTQMNRMGKTATKASADTAKVRSNVSSMSKAVVGATGSFSSLVKTGAIMSIGWQAINGVLTATIQMFKDLITGGIELEAALIAIETVTRKTGRNFGEVMQLMTKHTDAFMTKTALAPGMLRLLSTSLSTAQIDKFIQSVKDGSTAMGFQANEQLPILARGFKQLTANILDNIGVTVNLNRLRRQASRDLGIAADLLSETQIHQELYNQVILQTEKFQGLYNEQLETAKGAMNSVSAAWVSLTETVGNTEAIQKASEGTANLISSIEDFVIVTRERMKVLDEAKKAEEELAKQEEELGTGSDELSEHMAKNREEVRRMADEMEGPAGTALRNFFTNMDTLGDAIERVGERTRQNIINKMSESANSVERTNEQILNFAKNEEAIIATLQDFARTMTLTNLTTEEFNKILGNNEAALNTLTVQTGLSRDELIELGIEELRTAQQGNELEQSINGIEQGLRNMNKSISDTLEAQALLEPSIAAIADELEDQISKRDELQRLITDERNSIDILTSSIDTENRALRQHRIQLREVTSQLRNWTKEQRDAEAAVSELQRTLQKKMEVLFPDLFPEPTEQQLEETRKTREQLFQQKMSTEERMKQATSVRQYNELLAEAAALQAEIEKLDEKDIELTAKLTEEVNGLQSELSKQNSRLAEATAHVSSLTARQTELNSMVREGTDKIGTWNEQLRDARARVAEWEEQLLPLTETNGIIDELNAKLTDAITKWKEFSELKDIEKRITIFENRVFTGGGGGSSGEQTPSGTIFNNQTFSIRIGQVSAGTPEARTSFFKGLKQAIGARVGDV